MRKKNGIYNSLIKGLNQSYQVNPYKIIKYTQDQISHYKKIIITRLGIPTQFDLSNLINLTNHVNMINQKLVSHNKRQRQKKTKQNLSALN